MAQNCLGDRVKVTSDNYGYIYIWDARNSRKLIYLSNTLVHYPQIHSNPRSAYTRDTNANVSCKLQAANQPLEPLSFRLLMLEL